jgi:hypothetical protein
MPLKKGKSHDVIAGNIKELVGAGHDPKQAVAIALSHSRKYAEGGEVMDDEDEMLNRTIGEINADGVDYSEKISNPMQQKMDMNFANMIHKKAMMDMDQEGYAMGGFVEGEKDAPVGNKPSEDMASSTEEPMSSMPKKMGAAAMLDEVAMKAIADKKKKRRFAQ